MSQSVKFSNVNTLFSKALNKKSITIFKIHFSQEPEIVRSI